ncbi:MAG TPA: phosphatase PAP2 family protein [Candidatus Tyrphobacter sp.]|nr:phosphatase PAP2 family protein [Candidatus Tyrphobacter sp.]
MIAMVAVLAAKYFYLVSLAITGYAFLKLNREKRWRFVYFAGLGLPLVFILSRIASYFYFDPRPFVLHHFTPLIAHLPDNGFPSDHALLAFALMALVYLFDSKLGIILGLLGIVISWSRIYVGLHSPLDVSAGFGLSVLGFLTTYLIFKKTPLEKTLTGWRSKFSSK